MIRQILKILKSAENPLSLNVISQQLAIERSALEAMLNHLVQKGKIEKFSPHTPGKDNSFHLCGGCQNHSYCAVSMCTPAYYSLKQPEKK
jgi:predicted transcriptional regulator